jgi:menaquinol-cytochrome c reductase iron-sulfur subunit
MSIRNREDLHDDFSDARRRFLKLAIGALTAVSGFVLGLPLIRTIYRSAPVTAAGWSAAAKLAALPFGRPASINFQTQSEDAYIRGDTVHSVWVIRHAENDLTVFSPVCTHLGCYYAWNQQAGRFECPCHGSVFSMDGKVLGGPAPRPLDTLPHKVENGTLYVRWETFKSGTAKKIVV